MRKLLAAMLLTGLIGVTGANAQIAQTRTVDIRLINGFGQPITISITDYFNSRKIDSTATPTLPASDRKSQAKLGLGDQMEIVILVKIPDDAKSSGNYCMRVRTNMKGQKEYRDTLVKMKMQEGTFC